MQNLNPPKLIASDLVSITPMEFEFITPPGMTQTTFWSTVTVIPTYCKKSKILKVKEWLSIKNMTIDIKGYDINKDIFSRYYQKKVNPEFYATIK